MHLQKLGLDYYIGTEPKPVCRMQSGRDAAYAVTGRIYKKYSHVILIGFIV